MTREELKSADTISLISALQYCGRDSYYATYYDEVVDEITKRLNRIAELEKENAELKRDKSELCNAINEEGKAWVKLNEKLSKAKGFIEKLLIVSCNSEILIQYPNCKEVLEARVALEQFLMEK